MKYSLECVVDSKIFIGKEMKIVEGRKEYILNPNKDGMLASIKIITKVDNPERFYSKMEYNNEKIKHIVIEADPPVFDELKSDFQYIESALAFIGNLRRVHWYEPKQEWIPETEKERSKLKVFTAHFARKSPETQTRLKREHFVDVLRTKDRFDCLTTLKSFYRKGKNAFDQALYIDAFYNFYFIIEDLFGGGKTRNKQIEESFKTSTEFKRVIDWVMDKVINTSEKHLKNISNILGEKNLQNTPEGIIKLLVGMRGQLHHYTSKSSLKQPTPFVQMDFESLAFMTMGIAMKSLLNCQNRIKTQNQSPG